MFFEAITYVNERSTICLHRRSFLFHWPGVIASSSCFQCRICLTYVLRGSTHIKYSGHHAIRSRLGPTGGGSIFGAVTNMNACCTTILHRRSFPFHCQHVIASSSGFQCRGLPNRRSQSSLLRENIFMATCN